PNSTYQPDSSYSCADSLGFKVSDGHVDCSEATVNIRVLPHESAAFLIDVNFYAHLSSSLDTVKTGLAAIGHSSDDFWNHYSRDNPQGGWLSLGSLSGLKTVEGNETEAGLVVANAPGAWGNGSSDAMYRTYLYPFSGNATITVTNLPAGRYSLYVYGQDAGYQLAAGDGTDYGTLSTSNAPISNPVVWQEGEQYAVFRGVQVTNVGQSLTLTVSP